MLGNLSQNGQKLTQLMTSPTKTQNLFFLLQTIRLTLLRVWIALQHNRLASYGVAKRHYKTRFIRTVGAVKVLKTF